MRVSTEEKNRSRQRILEAASGLFRQKGVEGASVGDIMQAAGMTHGGFYRHFADKDALLAAAVAEAFACFAKPLLDSPEPKEALATFRNIYLSDGHRSAPGQGCPAAALGPEIARADPSVRQAFTAGVNLMADGIGRGLPEGETARRDALRDLAMMVGAIVLARAADDSLATEILEACERPAS